VRDLEARPGSPSARCHRPMGSIDGVSRTERYRASPSAGEDLVATSGASGAVTPERTDAFRQLCFGELDRSSSRAVVVSCR